MAAQNWRHQLNDAGIYKGEIWVERNVLQELGYPGSQEGVIPLAGELGWEICFFHPESAKLPLPAGGTKELVAKAHGAGLLAGVAVDGFFETSVARLGWAPALTGLIKSPEQIRRAWRADYDRLARLVAEAIDCGAEIVLICDDLAFHGGLYFDPQLFQRELLPLYQELNLQFGSETILGFHSDGRMNQILPMLEAAGFTCFSLEPEELDPANLDSLLDPKSILISGLKAGWLSGAISEEGLVEIKKFLAALKVRGPLILSSCCGIFQSGFIANLKQIYHLLDES